MAKGHLSFPTTIPKLEVMHSDKTLNTYTGCRLFGEFLNFFSAVRPRSLDPSKDLAVYGYGSIAWKERMESWKQKQEKQQMNGEGGEDEFDLSM